MAGKMEPRASGIYSTFVLFNCALLLFLLAGTAALPIQAQSPVWEWEKLFNGVDLSGWEKIGSGGVWTVQNGELVGAWDVNNPGNSWLVSNVEYDNFHLRFRYKAPAEVNSGVCYRVPPSGKARPARSGYEADIHGTPDSGWPTGSVWTYARAYAGLASADEWNSYEIIAVGDYMAIKVNGRPATEFHDRKSSKGVFALQQQGQGHAIAFKEIEIQRLSGPEKLGPTLKEGLDNAPGKFVRLFNGKNLDGWQSMWGGIWKVEAGAIRGNVPEPGYPWIMTRRDYADFILRIKIKISPRSNGGIAVRFPWPDEPEVNRITPAHLGYEVQVLDKQEPEVVDPAGSLYNTRRAPADLFKSGEWNQYEIYARGDHIIVYLNGQKASEAHFSRSLTGRIGVQCHQLEEEGDPHTTIWAKDIEIKEVK